jgi:2-polyprenyl-6-methoxyphenol hydroxylase-like FAD-dependent oxidoreductase
MRVIIIGGGIGGLTTALALHAAGIEAAVYEASATVRPLGVGINLQPHAVRELTELGLGDALAETGIATQELVYANRFGQVIWREDRGLRAGYRWPQYSIHRGRLQTLLWEVTQARLGPARVQAGKRLASFTQDEGSVTARFADGSTATADLLIAADGIHSVVRQHFAPDEGPPKWNGAILWRATSEAPAYLTGASMVQAGSHDQKFVVYPIAELPGGRRLTNWIAEIRFEPDHVWNREDWNRPGRLADVLPAFESWDFGWLDVPGLMRRAEAVFEFPMVDRDPLERWTDGRVTLLGDAAHPMYPIGSNGASQAILDARRIAWHLATAPGWPEALTAYEAERRPATAAIVAANRGLGPDLVLELVHQRAPDGFADLDAVISRRELEETASGYKTLAGFDPAVLNARESWSVTTGRPS